jgi:nucleoid-associated protein YgaU
MVSNKLYLQAIAPSQDAKDKVWDVIKSIDPTYPDLICDITIDTSLAAASRTLPPQLVTESIDARGGTPVQVKLPTEYMVKPGDTLSKLSLLFYGNAGHWMKIFQANQPLLKDPNEIEVGQKLTIPE